MKYVNEGVQEDECSGQCHHERGSHTVRFLRPDGQYDLGCSECGCACNKFIEPKKVKVK